MKTVLAYLRPYRRRMAAGFTVKVIATLTELLLPYILSHILKNVVAFQGIPQILLWGGAMVVFAAIGMVGNIVANRMAERVTVTFSENLRRDLFARTLRLSAAQTDRFTVASLESRITTDTYHVHRFIGMVQRIGVRAPILLIGGIAVTMIMDPFLSMIMVAMLPPIFLIVYTVSRLGVPLYTRVQDSVDRMVRVVREDIAGIRVIKALSKNDYENRRYDATNRALSRNERVAGAVTGIVNPVMTLLMNCGIVAVIAVSANRVAGHQSDPETVIAFMQYFTMISMSMMTLSRIFLMFSKCSASAKRIEEVLISPEEQETLPLRQAPDPRPVHLSMKNVSFAYGGGGRRLKNVSFELMRGQRLGIIGATGSGKSTLIRLLMRFYDATEGTVFIGGRDVRTYSTEERTAMFGVALQNDFLYADTVEENIRFGRNVSSEEIRRAARIAQAADFIEALDGGYSYRLAPKGTNLSGGQRQRLLIARALAGDPEILILDDSSSALDYKTDAALRRALAEELKDTTTVTVAQRVSSVKDCDLILVLEEGEIIGRGTHEELMESCPIYREISDSQMGGAFVE